ncbi:MAG: SBBP repeat-containing protein [Nitrospirae bacterium]|nr:SBBP repeat-containing protein [Nitrospirota bacterium]
MSNGKISKNVISIVVSLMTVICLSALAYANVQAATANEDNARVAESYGRLPIAFEVNEGQTDPKVKYFARGHGYTLFMTPREFVLSMATHDQANDKIKTASIRIKFVNPGADAKTITGIDELPGTSNYFIGNDPQKWRTNVPTYEKVKYEKVYPGVDMVVYGNQRQIEYDFVVGPHADYKQITLRVEGAKTLKVDKDGNLIIASKGGKMLMHKPLVYQETDGIKQEIKGRYAVGKGNLVSFNVADYDKNKELVIDPTLAYSTFLGGSNSGSSGDFGRSIAVDSSGNAYVAGFTASTDFPVTSGAYQTTLKGTSDVFITKLNATGTALVYSTYLGGSGSDDVYSIVVDSSGNAYVTGETYSADFPTIGAYQTTRKGASDAYITKLNSTGTALVYSTLLGGDGYDGGRSIAVDSAGNAYVAGETRSSDFPVTSGAFKTTTNSASTVFITKLNAAGTQLAYSTLLVGDYSSYSYSGGIAVDSSGNAYVTGFTYQKDFPTTTGAFQTTFVPTTQKQFTPYVTKLNATGTALVYSTFLGGSYADSGVSIAVDSAGNAYVAGGTYSTDFPTTTSAFQTTMKGICTVFITKLNATGTALVYSTLLGGNSADYASGIAIDSAGNAHVAGYTSSTNFPTTTGAYQTTLKGSTDVFITKLNATGTALVYSTLLGGTSSSYDSASGIAVDSSGDAYVTGETTSTDFPVTTGAYQTTLKGTYDAFITKLRLSSPEYYYKLSVNKTGSGTVTSTPSGISCDATCSSTYTSGTSVTLTATASYNSAFSGWSGCDSTSGTQCTVTMSSDKSVSAAFSSSGASDYDNASAAINSFYNQYPTFFGTKSGGVTTATTTNGTYYAQWFVNGTAIMAWTDGYIWYWDGSNAYNTGIAWKANSDLTRATAGINAIYNQYASWFGTKSGSILTGTSSSAMYYVQWCTNGAAIVAWTDGTMYTYYNSSWYALGVSWK